MDIPIKAVIHRAEEGGYWAEVPAFPGCVTEAETRDELLRNIRDAVEGWLIGKAELAKIEEPGEVVTL